MGDGPPGVRLLQSRVKIRIVPSEPDGPSLAEAKRALQEQLETGATCPCCGQFAKIYRRKINSGMSRSLIAMYRAKRTDWVYLPTEVGARSREEGKLRWWGLVEESSTVREDGGRAGWWRVTDKGRLFVLGAISVPKYAVVYNNWLIRLEGNDTSIVQSLGDKFNYDELMRGPQ